MSSTERLRAWFTADGPQTLEDHAPFVGGDYVAIDFETANEKRASACAVGIAVVEGGEVAHKKAWLIRPPEMRFNPINISIHGIRPTDVERAHSFPDLWPHLLHYLEGKVVIAHNAPFDISVLRHTLEFYELGRPRFDYSCTYAIAKRVWPGLSTHGLGAVAAHLGLTMTHHDPGDDAEAAANIVLRACSHLGFSSLADLTKSLDLRRRRF